MKAKVFFAMGAVVAVLITLALRAVRQNTHANEALAAAAGQRAELREKLQRVELRVQAAQTVLAAVEEKWWAAKTEAEASNAKPEVAAKSSGAAPERKVNPGTIVADTPHLMAEYAKNFRASLDWEYGGMFKALHLSPEQIEKFKDIELSLQQTRMDLHAAAESHRLDRDSDGYKKLYADYERSRLTKKAELLGDLTEQYSEYYRTGGARGYAKQLAWTGIYTGEKVTAEQVERATDVLIANSNRRTDANGTSAPGVEPGTVNWPAARAQLQGMLSPSQIETLGLFVERGAGQSKVDEQVKRLTAQFKGEKPAK